MGKDNMFPQFGIVTSLNGDIREAKVYLPLLDMETDYIDIAANIPLTGEKLKIKVEGITVRVDNNSYNAEYSDGSQAVVSSVKGLENGSHVIVSFMDGNAENAVVTALL